MKGKNRLIIRQLVNQVSSLDDQERQKVLDAAVDQGVIDELSAFQLIRTIKVLEEKESLKDKP